MVCTRWLPDRSGPECSCECHARVTKMFEEFGMERIAQQNPEWSPAPRTFWMPTPEERVQLRMQELELEKRMQRNPLEVTAITYRDQTPTGQRARGQLEDEVLLVCSQFTRGELDEEVLTPAVIARLIDDVQPPSVGAIGAVFSRWVKVGFANCPKRPVRFESFTVEGMQRGLEYMKTKHKLKARAESRKPAGKLAGRSF